MTAGRAARSRFVDPASPIHSRKEWRGRNWSRVCFGPRLRPATQRSRRAYPLFHRRPFREPWTILDRLEPAAQAAGTKPTSHARGQEAPAAGMKSEPGPPITLGNPAAVRVRLIVCCLDWRHQANPTRPRRQGATAPRRPCRIGESGLYARIVASAEAQRRRR